MTRHTLSSDSIDRRTALGLLSGGLATLAGCIGGSNNSPSGTDAGPDSGSSAGSGEQSTGWVPPEQQSEYIRSSEFVVDNDSSLLLDLRLQNSSDIGTFELIDVRGNRYETAYPYEGDSIQLPLVDFGLGESEPEAITRGENTLVIEVADGSDQQIPIRLGTEMEFQRVLVGTSPNGYDNALKIEVKNTGTHPTAAWSTQYTNTPAYRQNDDLGESGRLDHDFNLIQPGETGVISHTQSLWRTRQCTEYDERTMELTLNFLWADSVAVSQRASYVDGESDACGTLVGSASEMHSETSGAR